MELYSNNVVIRRATTNDIPQLYVFNQRMYPNRFNYREIIDFWISKSDAEINNIIIVVDNNNRIKGQQFFSSMSYYYEGKEIGSTWAFDLIVDESLRSGSYGFSLMWKCKKEHPNSMSSGSNDISLPINLKIGNKYLGDLRKYIGISNPLLIPTSFFRGIIPQNKFPKKVILTNYSFERVDDCNNLAKYISCFNEDLLEISRKQDFLKWRFYSGLHEYVLYRSNVNNDYFVVRTIVRKKITMLVLIDFRCDFSTMSFESVMVAFRKIASTLKIGVLIVGSSMSKVDGICEKYKMRAIGRHRPIIGFTNCYNKEKIEKRDFVLLTLADSDGDITW